MTHKNYVNKIVMPDVCGQVLGSAPRKYMIQSNIYHLIFCTLGDPLGAENSYAAVSFPAQIQFNPRITGRDTKTLSLSSVELSK